MRKKPRYFYGWSIVGAAFLAHLSYAEQYSTMLGFFFKPFQNEFGWSRTALSIVHSIARVVEAVVAPIVGPLIDRYGPRVLMPIGAIIVGLAMLGVTQITAIWQFYLLRGIISAIGFTIMGSLVTDVTINNWFIRKRGRAIGISRVGTNLSNVIMTPVTVFVLAASGWRTMFVVFAIITWLFVVIPSAILMRRRPEDMGLYPDGIDPGTAKTQSSREEPASSVTESPSPLEPVWSRREVLVNGTFWLLAAAIAIAQFAYQGINISIVPYIQDLGYGDATLATVMTFRAIIASIALLFMGFVAEHADRTMVRVVPFVIEGVGAFLFLLAGQQPVFLWLAISVYAFGFSGVTVLQEVIYANYYGRLSLGMVRSLGYLLSSGVSGLGPIAFNAVFDILGSYRLAFMAVIGLFVVAAVLIGIALPPKPHRYATVAEMTPSAGKRQSH
ncbi:MAG: MFS transporter [Chloroflexi bacterium]|nr:MFS transporter [Chloroflexota bacterium]